MSCRLFRIAIVLGLGVIATCCAGYQKEQCEKIAATTELHLRARDFEKLYEDLDESARASTPETEFLERADQLVTAMVAADAELRFVKSREGGVNPDNVQDLYFEFRTLGSGENHFDVEISIELNGISPKLFDVCGRRTDPSASETEHCPTNALRKI